MQYYQGKCKRVNALKVQEKKKIRGVPKNWVY
jgi:hypothetical protein